MDTDENDLLFTNTFIPAPELQSEVLSENSSEFRRYYERERSINEEKRLRESIEKAYADAKAALDQFVSSETSSLYLLAAKVPGRSEYANI